MKRSLGAIAFIILCLSSTTSMSAATPAEPKTPLRSIRLDATGSVKAKPDMAQITLGVASEGDTARAALDQNNAATARVIDVLKQSDVTPEDIQTVDFSVRPRYEPNKGSDKTAIINGYRVVNLLRITVRNLNRLGEILDKAVTQGSNEIGGIMFDVAEPAKLLDEARKRAMENAKARASLYAAAAGASLGRVLTVDEQSVSPWRPRTYGATRMDAKAVEVPIQSGEAELQVQISVMWELEDEKPNSQ